MFSLFQTFYYVRLLLALVFSTDAAFPPDGISNPGKNEKIFPVHEQYSAGLSDTIDRIIAHGQTLLGKPYRYKTEGRMLDCSGFVSYICSKLGFQLSRSCPGIANEVVKVDYGSISRGDILFFKGSNKSSEGVGHVGMVTAVANDQIEFMHSCNRGIIVEKYNTNRYYLDRFLFAGRIPKFQKDLLKVGAGNQPANAAGSQQSGDPGEAVIKLMGVGDIMLGSNYPDNSNLPPNDGKDILNPVKELLASADLTFGNLEGVLLTGAGNVKKCSDPKVCYAFKSPVHYVNYLKEAGFDLLSVANNHVQDFGAPGTKSTTKTLDEAGLHYAGLQSCPYTIFKHKGLTFGFAAFAPNNGTVSLLDLDNARKIVSKLDSACDIVIVSFHGGGEGTSRRHITKDTEMFLGENRGNPYKFARKVIDAGADVVLGHGPHVTRAIDLYKGKFIAYSMGNFATYGRFSLSGPSGHAPIVELNLDAKGNFIDGKIHSTRQIAPGGPIMDEKGNALSEIIELTKSDVPECELQIADDGSIRRKN
jgi:poly-gamma-glutamate capsule biosynthesis protein CapA/YwtB (metallophosphatase superfamily)